MEARAPAGVHFTGRIGDSELADRLADCRALVYPQEEDFGIAAVEAQAAGRPVIALAAGGALDSVRPTVTIRVDGSVDDLGDTRGTGVHFEGQDVASLIRAVRAFEDQEHRFEPKRIRDHAEQFSPQRFLDALEHEVDCTLAGHG